MVVDCWCERVTWFRVVVRLSVLVVSLDRVLADGLVRHLFFLPTLKHLRGWKIQNGCETGMTWMNDGVECNCDYVWLLLWFIHMVINVCCVHEYPFWIAFNSCVILLTKCTMWCYSFSIIIPPVDVIALSTCVVVSNQCFSQINFSHCITIFIKNPFKNSIKTAKIKSSLLLN